MMRLAAVLHNMLFVIAGYCSDMIRLTKQRICKAQGYDLARCGERSLTEAGCTTNTACTGSGFSPLCARNTHPILLTISQVHCALRKKAVHLQRKVKSLIFKLNCKS